MWRLESEKENVKAGVIYHVLADEELTVGRKDCDIMIVKDASVSRKHASIRASHPMCNIGNLNLRSVCLLRDFGSKYGTFVNGKQVGDQGVILNHDDVITFGQCGSNFKVIFTPIVITTSCMESEEKLSLKEVIRKLGGHVIDEWNTECTHLAMTKIKVTVKTVCALASNKPVVNGNYFRMLLDCCNTKTPLEDVDKFLPELDEVLLNQEHVRFTRNPERSQLFKNKVFIFLTSHQYLKLRLPITLASGKVILINKSRCDVTSELLQSSCVIQCPVEGGKSQSRQSQSQTCSSKEIEDIENLLQKHKKRFIPESDVGLAVVHCSIEQYCNPDYEFDSTQSTSVTSRNLKLQSQSLSQNVCIPETWENAQHSFDSAKTTEIPPTFATSSESCMSTVKASVDPTSHVHTKTKKRSASSELTECSSLKVLKTEFRAELENEPSDDSTSNLDNNTQPSLFNSNVTSRITRDNDSSVITTRRPLPSASDTSTSAENGHSLRRKSPATEKVKVEPPSPPMFEDDDMDCQSGFDADTQPAPQNNFKEEAQETDTVPLKRMRLDPEPEKCQQPSTSTTKAASDSGNSSKKNGVLLSSGFLGSRKTQKVSENSVDEQDESEELPSNLLVVKLAELVVERSRRTNVQRESCPAVKNFKKFRKTANCGANRLPTIIGENDLIVHTSKENLNELNEILQNQESEQTQASMGCNTSFRAQFARLARTVK